MKRGGPTKIGAILMILIMAVVLFGGFYLAGKFLLGGENQNNSGEEVNLGQQLLDKPNDKTAVRMSVRGPITAQEEHYSIALTINASARELLIFRGYEGKIMTQEKLENSKASFDDFLSALSRAGMAKESQNEENPQGICAIGQIIKFEIFENHQNENGAISEKSAKSLWTTSCPGLTGNFDGLTANVIALFLDQIPDARNRISAAKNELNIENRAKIGNPMDGLEAFEAN